MKLRFTNDWLRSQIEKDAVHRMRCRHSLRDSAPIARFAQPEAATTAVAPSAKWPC